jgi:hypothetical protein
MPKDGLRPLPDDIVAPLLRALVTIRPTPEARLYLQRAEYGRAPGWDADTDYNVLFRSRPVGRIWRFIYAGDTWQDYPWHWQISPLNDEQKVDWGHAMTLIEAMEHFRRAWDAHVYKTAMKRARD